MPSVLLDWLSRADPPAPADVIFVLAGEKSRKLFAIQLFGQGMARRLLLSVGRFEIQRFRELGLPPKINLLEMAQSIPPPQRHFFVLFEEQDFTVQRIPVRLFGTLGEIDALRDWLLAYPDISSLAIVSSGPHLRRLRMCCRRMLKRNVKCSFVATPAEVPDSGPKRKALWLECFKIACYAVIVPFWEIARFGRWNIPSLKERK